MKKKHNHMLLLIFVFLLASLSLSCQQDKPSGENDPVFYAPGEFVMGADLSYVNQILDHGGQYFDSGSHRDPYLIFKQHGANVARFRLFHTPSWTKEIYGTEGTRMYNDLQDVGLGISRAKEQGMQVCLDFHYSDTWADPGKQIPPAAWEGLDLETLADSIYQYTLATLKYLDVLGLMPEFVQVGNEINPGLVLPAGKRWEGNENHMVMLLNEGIRAVRDAGAASSVQPEIILHIAQPENVLNWFNGLSAAGLTDYDILGLSYYYIWSEVPLDQVSNYVGLIGRTLEKEVMVMETAYPWTTANADNYPNIIEQDKQEPGYPFSELSQFKYLVDLTQEIIDGGGKGIFYWEPAWITSGMKTQWGQGSAWDSNALFDFSGNVIMGMDFMTQPYKF